MQPNSASWEVSSQTGYVIPANQPAPHVLSIVTVVGFTVMTYDHVLTFTDEVGIPASAVLPLANNEFYIKVQYIWKAKKTPVMLMFLLVCMYVLSVACWNLLFALFRTATSPRLSSPLTQVFSTQFKLRSKTNS